MTAGLADPAVLLATWEQAQAAPEGCRGAVVVACAWGTEPDDALDLPLGEVARRAVLAHDALFGDALVGVTPCRACGELLEVDLPLPPAGDPPPDAARVAVAEDSGGWLVHALTTRDLLLAADSADPATALLQRSVRADDDEEVPRGAALQAVDDAAERLAGLAATRLVLRCPSCAAQVRVSLDVGAFLWQRVQQLAVRLLADVAALAAAFGWSEDQVLALPPARRRAYLALAAT